MRTKFTPLCWKKRRSSMARTASTMTLGNLVVFHHLALGALVALEQRRDHLRFQFVGRELAARLPLMLSTCPPVMRMSGRLRAVIRLPARADFDATRRTAGNSPSASRRSFRNIRRGAVRLRSPCRSIFSPTVTLVRHGINFGGVAQRPAL